MTDSALSDSSRLGSTFCSATPRAFEPLTGVSRHDVGGHAQRPPVSRGGCAHPRRAPGANTHTSLGHLTARDGGACAAPARGPWSPGLGAGRGCVVLLRLWCVPPKARRQGRYMRGAAVPIFYHYF